MTARLLTRAGCGLCDTFYAQWLSAFPGVALDRVNIDKWPQLQAEYGTRIPVLLDADDRVVCEGHFDAQACRALVDAMTGRG